MLFKRIFQFIIVYFTGIISLMIIKYTLSLSNYVIPGLPELAETACDHFGQYFFDVINTLSVTLLGQIISIFMAFAVGIAGRKSSWTGSFIKVTAYNIQAFPIVALAPIIFILLGDGFLSRLLIASMICYFPHL
ncbi:MAG: ABC transporter permease, partial [Desulfamplus sp.]|nr:ABC transporter permease [Desulfamplus sp.]